MIEKIGKVKLNLEFYSGTDLYSDGEVEDKLLQTVKEYKPEEFNAIIDKEKNWPFLYHLSHIRPNIISFLPITKEDEVLEIGAGCGAITGKLAEKAKKVTCIELSKKRSEINAYRNIKRDNIEILVGNFQTIESRLEKKYDYITLIGVYEYAESYIQDSEDPYQEFLEIITKHLKDDGKVVIAIENKYGMKYFAGWKEDHVNKYFESIEDYSTTSGVKTFAKERLLQYASECGLDTYKCYYPYPDYKLPMVIYSDEHLPKVGELGRFCNYNFDQDRMELFDINKAFDSCIRDGMFQHYANSYLLVLGR